MNKRMAKEVKRIKVPPELRPLLISLNKLKNVLIMCQISLNVVGEYYLNLKTEVDRLIDLTQKIKADELKLKRKQ